METIELEPLSEEKQNYLEDINRYLNQNRSGYIKVPTGWGKTFLAKHLMKQYYQQGKVVLFLVSRNNQLLNQTFYIDKQKSVPLFPNSLALSSEHGKKNALELQKHLVNRNSGFVVFASLQTVLNNEGLANILSQTTDLVIIDEIHNFIDNKGSDFINGINKNTRILGMTATPFQGIVGHVKFVEDIAEDMSEIFSKTLPQCIIEGQLSELNYVIIRSNQDIQELFDFQRGLYELDKDELYLDCSSIEKINAIIRRTKLAKQIYDQETLNSLSKTLIFCAPVKNIVQEVEHDEKKIPAFHAKMCSAIFNDELKDTIDASFSFHNKSSTGGFKNAVYLSSDLPQKERDSILRYFRETSSPPYTLCTVGMLVEGFDFPDMESLILLRPTLSMRLFEQQVGRVTRLPQSSNKRRGNIFEIADDIDSLYDKFKENVFDGNKIERIQMLQPENRIEELFTEGNAVEAIRTGKIRVSDINFGGSVGKFYQNSVDIPPVNLRARYFCKLLAMIEERTYGKFSREKEKLMKMAVGFKLHNVESTTQIANLISLLDKLEYEACHDSRLGANCAKHKPPVFNEVRWLLTLRALTCLQYYCNNLDSNEKSNILRILGFTANYEEIENYRLSCLRNGRARNIDVNDFVEWLVNLKGLSAFFPRAKQEFVPIICWASCFVMDQPKLRDLFESKEWSHEVNKYVIGRR